MVAWSWAKVDNDLVAVVSSDEMLDKWECRNRIERMVGLGYIVLERERERKVRYGTSRRIEFRIYLLLVLVKLNGAV